VNSRFTERHPFRATFAGCCDRFLTPFVRWVSARERHFVHALSEDCGKRPESIQTNELQTTLSRYELIAIFSHSGYCQMIGSFRVRKKKANGPTFDWSSYWRHSMTHLILVLLIGIAAGWLSGRIMKGRGFGLIGDLVVGIVGAAIGDIFLMRLGFTPMELLPNSSRRQWARWYFCSQSKSSKATASDKSPRLLALLILTIYIR